MLPDPVKVQAFIDKLQALFHRHASLEPAALILLLNPVLRG